jgi:hypothetical protein
VVGADELLLDLFSELVEVLEVVFLFFEVVDDAVAWRSIELGSVVEKQGAFESLLQAYFFARRGFPRRLELETIVHDEKDNSVFDFVLKAVGGRIHLLDDVQVAHEGARVLPPLLRVLEHFEVLLLIFTFEVEIGARDVFGDEFVDPLDGELLVPGIVSQHLAAPPGEASLCCRSSG